MFVCFLGVHDIDLADEEEANKLTNPTEEDSDEYDSGGSGVALTPPDSPRAPSYLAANGAVIDPEKDIYNPTYNTGWVTKYCTMKEVDNFILYFPYVLLLIPLIMVGMERGLIR